MKSDLLRPIGVVGVLLFTCLLMALIFDYGNRPFAEADYQAPDSWYWVAEGGDAGSGRALFAANCASCHQDDGRGKIGLAPSVRNRDFLALASDGFIRTTIHQGRPGTAMIPRPDFDDQSISDIIAYLRALPIANPVHVAVDPDRVITGDYLNGDILYTTYCASCHGLNGEGYSAGGSGPGIGLSGFLDVVADDYILQTVKQGRIGTPMMPFMGAKGVANLDERDVGDIIAFLRRNAHRMKYSGGKRKEGPPDPGKGQNLFAANCMACHQEGGTGMVGLAPSIRNRDFLALASDDFIRETVTLGRPGTAMVGRPDISEASVDHIIAYLRSLPIANPVDITLDAAYQATGDIEAGRTKYGTFCASCHGPNGEGYSAGGSGPAIGLAGFLDVASDDYILQTVKQGRVGTAMMPFVGARGLANLQESDVEDMIVYLRSLNTQ